MSASWWMTASRRQIPRGRKTIRWDVLGLQDPAVTSIEDVRRQVISASNSGLSTETLARASKKTLSPQSAKKPVSAQMQNQGISKSRKKGLLPKGKLSEALTPKPVCE